MSLKIVERRVGEVTILDLIGRTTLGEGASSLRDTIICLIEKRRTKIILNYSEVTYQDSSGNGELVSGFTRVVNSGGSLVLLHPSKRIKDLLQITKLYTVFEVFENEFDALRYLGGTAAHSVCPICGARGVPALIEGDAWRPQTCSSPECSAEFVLSSSGGSYERVRVPTYPDEYFEAVAGVPMRIRVVGRLSLFTVSGFRKLWGALPCRDALVDLRRATEVTPEGRDAMLALLPKATFMESVTVSLEGASPESARMFEGRAHVYGTDASARAALGEFLGGAHEWPARFE